jgi:hypothetical protein
MTNTLTDKEVKILIDLFDKIKLDLSDSGLPTRTNRLEAVENMKKVIEIHGYDISEQKTAEELSEDKHQGREEHFMADARDQHLINKNLNKATGGK